MSWCPDRGVPWPLRGALRNSEADLLRVDGHTLKVATAIVLMDLVWNDDDLVTRLVDAAIIHQHQARFAIDPGDITDEQLQGVVDEFRGRRNLLTAEDTERWLAERGLDHRRLEIILIDNLLRARVRDRVLGMEVATGPAEAAALDRVALEWLGADDAAEAGAMFARLRDGETCMADELRRRFIAGAPAEAPFTWLARRDLPADVAERLFAAPVGTLVEPFALAGRHRVARILAIAAADPADPDVAEALRESSFASWLAERRRGAEIQWFWGFDRNNA
jgi:putative peptide maturation system protein